MLHHPHSYTVYLLTSPTPLHLHLVKHFVENYPLCCCSGITIRLSLKCLSRLIFCLTLVYRALRHPALSVIPVVLTLVRALHTCHLLTGLCRSCSLGWQDCAVVPVPLSTKSAICNTQQYRANQVPGLPPLSR